ncbi:MAG: ribosome recycling factor [Candidatus Yanofskybacteria bacterium]|nr:ribosome recycling factor [Candidatus Yanofskybacteria bacterium]
MYQEIIAGIRPETEKMYDFFSRELAKIRTGQASPALVEDVPVSAFESVMPLKQLAGISCPERNQIVIQPWDRSYLGPIEKALQQAGLGISPVVDKDIVRITLPPMTQEFRDKLLKIIAEKSEETREGIRKLRDEAWGKIQEKARTGEVREDDKFKGKEDLQKIVDEYNKKIDELIERKKREISL